MLSRWIDACDPYTNTERRLLKEPHMQEKARDRRGHFEVLEPLEWSRYRRRRDAWRPEQLFYDCFCTGHSKCDTKDTQHNTAYRVDAPHRGHSILK